MARNLYRFYLYTVFIALLIFATVVTAQLLSTLFQFTPLRGTYDTAPTHSALVQSFVLALVGWIITGALGGLHYWLIRRDMRSDPTASGSAIRAFFLNITEGLGVVISVPLLGFAVLDARASTAVGNVAFSLAASLATLVMVLVLELERRRTPEPRGVSLVFQRLHLFGVQVILLIFLGYAFYGSLRILVDSLFFAGKGGCDQYGCNAPNYNPWFLLLTLLWFTGFWLFYTQTTRRDSSRLVRMIVHGIGFAVGVGFVLGSVFIVFELLLLPLFHIPVELNEVLGSGVYDFLTPLVFGLLIAGIYHLLLRDLSVQGLVDPVVRHLSELAIAGILQAGFFWIGLDQVIYNVLQTIAPAPAKPENYAWVASIALTIAGLCYVFVGLYLRRSYARDALKAIGPRRGFVLALLGSGLLALAIGGAIALYTWGTFLLGAPVPGWMQTAHMGLSAAIVGALIVGLYLWSALREHLIVGRARSEHPSDPVPATPTTIEDILDELLAGHITRDEAVARIEVLEPGSGMATA